MRKRELIKKQVDEFNRWINGLKWDLPMRTLFSGFDKVLKKYLNEFSPNNQYKVTLKNILEMGESYRDDLIKSEHERDEAWAGWTRMKHESESLQEALSESVKKGVKLFNANTELKDQLEAATLDSNHTDMIIEQKDAEIQKLKDKLEYAKGAVQYSIDIFGMVFENKGKHCS